MQKRRAIVAATLAATVALLGSGIAAARASENSERPRVVAELQDASGTAVGLVRVSSGAHRSTVQVRVQGLAPGVHGFHVHAVGACAAPDFSSAGPHFNPGGASHPAHAGDMPVLLVNEDGTAFASFETDRFVVAQLRDADGSAFIVHAGPDNYANVPARYAPEGPDETTTKTGDAGPRIACGVVRPS